MSIPFTAPVRICPKCRAEIKGLICEWCAKHATGAPAEPEEKKKRKPKPEDKQERIDVPGRMIY